MRVAVLASGGGSNLQALLDAEAKGALGPARVVRVLCNVVGAGALARAIARGVPTRVMPNQEYPSREAYDAALVSQLRADDVDLVVLAGFLRLVTSALLDAFPDRVINVHPSLLPAFPGLHAQAQCLAYGAKVAGCTVHFVDAGTDSGPIIAQAAVAVRDDDTEASLAARILAEEHRLLPVVVRDLALGRLCREGRRVRRVA